MSRVNNDLIRRLCYSRETLSKALDIFHLASARTGVGSGYELGAGQIGLPAICAYLASQELQINEVNLKIAQTSACLAPKIFKTTLATVKAALAADVPEDDEEYADEIMQAESSELPKLSFEALVRKFNFTRGDFMISCMRDVEKALVESRELKGKFTPPADITTLTIFCWVCEILKIKKAKPKQLVQEYEIAPQDYNYVFEVICTSCDLLQKDIEQKVEAVRIQHRKELAKTRGARPNASPSKSSQSSQSMRPSQSEESSSLHPPQQQQQIQQLVPSTPQKSILRSPSKSVLKSGSSYTDSDFTLSPSKTPTSTAQKRKVAFSSDAGDDETREVDETPIRKRQKRGPYVHDVLPALQITPGDKDDEESSAVESPTKADETPRGRRTLIKSNVGRQDEDVEMKDVEPPTPSSSSLAASRLPSPQPSTPRRGRGRPRKVDLASLLPINVTFTPPQAHPRTPTRNRQISEVSSVTPRRKTHASQTMEVDEAEEHITRRHRPVQMDQQQWLARDPRVEMEWRIAENAKAVLVEKHGYPFERLRAKAIAAGVVIST